MFGAFNNNRNAANNKKPPDIGRKLMQIPPAIDLAITACCVGYALIDAVINKKSFITLLLLIIGLAFALLGILALLAEMKAVKLVEELAERGDLGELNDAQLRRAVLALFAVEGFKPDEAPDEKACYDFCLKKGKVSMLIRVRDWDDNRISIDAIKDLYRESTKKKQGAGILFGKGKLASDGAEWARKNGVLIMGADQLKRRILDAVGEPIDEKANTGQSLQEAGEGLVTNMEPDPPVSTYETYRIEDPAPLHSIVFLDYRLLDGHEANGLDTVMSNYPAARLVVTTMKDTPLDTVRAVLPLSGDQVDGVTPILPHFGQSARFYEILDYIKRSTRGQPVRWVALDSEPQAFPDGCSELIPVNLRTGIDASACAMLASRLAEIEEHLKRETSNYN